MRGIYIMKNYGHYEKFSYKLIKIRAITQTIYG